MGLPAAALVVAALVVPSLAGAAQGRTVRIKDIDFSPHSLTVDRGAVVTWRFLDAVVSHNVTSRGAQRFRSSPTQMSGTYSVRFTKPGTYRYHCTIHANMAGKVVVR